MEWNPTDKPAEHKESFFGVKLYEKIQDEIAGIGDIEDILGELAEGIVALEKTDEPEAFHQLVMDCKVTAESCAEILAEKRSFFSFYLGESDAINQIVLERDLNMTMCQILKWDKIDARELHKSVKNLTELGKRSGFSLRDLIKAGQIPSEHIPEEILRYPTWAVDRRGYCLVGTEMDRVMHLDEIIDEMEERRK